ncbi:phycobiliprotein lyase [Phormidium sp. CLA17]|uniref:phycobiliprotein lyase n=1 Tax=Leptolyngbya sp. Cla-17 TaxID=2803751 RepID=UPI001490C842|nr:phycobiliprotein lyase [Leptolyngbya sp. Cla-17]MBM0742869.1 phycobiliprotein lyase [Leptolyngbya sp. Cla-17]
MNIVEFFELSSGKWFSQRTSHHFNVEQSEAGKSDLVIEMVDKADPEVAQLCKQYSIDPALALCGARATWSGSMEQGGKKYAGSTMLVPVADPQKQNEGKLLRELSASEKSPVAGRYVVGSDEALTLITEDETMYAEERLWFASPNLRLRTSVLKRSGGFSMASFCSEIRMGVSKPAETTPSQA